MTDQPHFTFNLYPSVGEDDWRYVFATAKVRALETQMLSDADFADMVNAPDFETAAGMLDSTEYALTEGGKTIEAMEEMLQRRRSEVRKLFADLMLDVPLVEAIRARDDFANLRLALRRTVTEKPVGKDYSDDGNVAAEHFESIFEQENYSQLPEHMQEAVESAVLDYYENKDIRVIDHAIEKVQAAYKLKVAAKVKSVFLLELFRMQIDLTNVRTMLRLKFRESDARDVFLEGGYIEISLLKHCMDIGYEGITPLFMATPYATVVEEGVTYLQTNGSFLKIERACDEHIYGYLKSTNIITAGPQPVIAYLLMKESEIRMVRLILTAKKNDLDVSLIADRVMAYER
jgi:V/A-type H+-transporting ATPase subunit C